MHLLCDWGCPDVVTEVYDALLLRLKRWRESLFSISHVILCRLLIETFRPLLKVDIDSTHKRGPCCLYCTTPSAPPRSTTPKRIQRRITCLIPDFFFSFGEYTVCTFSYNIRPLCCRALDRLLSGWPVPLRERTLRRHAWAMSDLFIVS